MFKCKKCQFVYIYPTPTNKYLEKYYSVFKSNIFEKKDVIQDDSIHALQLLKKYKVNRKTLLDIGCGNGIFITEAIKYKWFPVGIDKSRKLIDYIKKNSLLNVHLADLLRYKCKEKYDLITLNQVIEHFHNPLLVIRKCKKLLKKSGLLYIATPNIDSFVSKIRKVEFDYIIPPEHLSYFSKRTIEIILKKYKFKILYIGSWSYPVDLAGIIKSFLNKKVQKTVNNKQKESKIRWFVIKRIKYLLFDQVFCRLFYKLLNINNGGTMIEVLAIKQ